MASGSSSDTNSHSKIKTIVVLVQENRSFDHMLGWMKSLNPEIDGVTGSESNPVSTSDPNSNRVQFGDRSVYVDPDPGHSIQDIYEQIFGEAWSDASSAKKLPPKMQGFVQNAVKNEAEKKKSKNDLPSMSETVMNGFTPDRVSVYRELVEEFAVCDRWFASVPASTQPNRLYVHSATSYGMTSNDTGKLIGGLPQKTIFDSLDENGFTFGIYYQLPPATLFYRFLSHSLCFLYLFYQREERAP